MACGGMRVIRRGAWGVQVNRGRVSAKVFSRVKTTSFSRKQRGLGGRTGWVETKGGRGEGTDYNGKTDEVLGVKEKVCA